jgi:hypothetical protein
MLYMLFWRVSVDRAQAIAIADSRTRRQGRGDQAERVPRRLDRTQGAHEAHAPRLFSGGGSRAEVRAKDEDGEQNAPRGCDHAVWLQFIVMFERNNMATTCHNAPTAPAAQASRKVARRFSGA